MGGQHIKWSAAQINNASEKVFQIGNLPFSFFGKVAIKIIMYEKVGKTLDEWGNGKS